MDFGQGVLAAVSKSSNASKELADDGKNILLIDSDSFTIITGSMEQRSSLRISVTQIASCAHAVYHQGSGIIQSR